MAASCCTESSDFVAMSVEGASSAQACRMNFCVLPQPTMNPPDSDAGRDACVLILEDSATLVTQITRALRVEMPGLRVLAARGVAEAQVLAAEFPIDFFLVDIHLPDGSGIDFLCDMQTAQPAAKGMIMTAVPLPEYREHAKALGVLQFIEKPLDLPRLAQSIGRAMGALSPAGTEEPQYFQASLSCLTPVDIIQLKCVGHVTQVVEFIRSDARRGRIHFCEGEVVHAESGVEAFNEIVSWRAGRVVELKDVRPVAATIHGDWQVLLMQAAHLLDEQALAS